MPQAAFISTCTLCAILSLPARAAAQEPTTDASTPVQKPVAAVEKLAPPAAAVAPGVGTLLGSLKKDLRNLATTQNLFLVGIGASGALSAHTWDDRVARTSWGAGQVHEMLEPGQFVGGALFQASAAAATYAVGRIAHSPRVAEVGAELVRAQLLSQTVTQTIKFSARRVRPDGTLLSFPSGHSASSFATATVLERNFGWKIGIPAYAVASWVAASRVQMDRHYMSDVIAGATVGILAGRSVTVGKGHARFAVSPLAAHGGAGVSFVKK